MYGQVEQLGHRGQVACQRRLRRGEQLGHRLQRGEPQLPGPRGRAPQQREGGGRPVDEQDGVGAQQVGLHDGDEQAGLQGELAGRGQRRGGRIPRGVLVAAQPEQRRDAPRRQPVLGGDLRDAAQVPVRLRPVGDEDPAGEDGQRLAQEHRLLVGRDARPLGDAHRLPAHRLGPRHVACAVRRVGGESQRARVAGPACPLDEPLRRLPPAADHRGAGEPQAQLGVLVAAHQARGEGGLAHLHRLGSAADQGEDAHPLDGHRARQPAGRRGPVQQLGGTAQRAAGDVGPGEPEEDLGAALPITGLDEEPGGRGQVLGVAPLDEGPRRARGERGPLGRQQRGEHRRPGQRVPPPQPPVLARQQADVGGGPQGSDDPGLRKPGHRGEQPPVRVAAGHRGGLHDRPVTVGQRRQPPGDEVRQRRRNLRRAPCPCRAAPRRGTATRPSG